MRGGGEAEHELVDVQSQLFLRDLGTHWPRELERLVLRRSEARRGCGSPGVPRVFERLFNIDGTARTDALGRLRGKR